MPQQVGGDVAERHKGDHDGRQRREDTLGPSDEHGSSAAAPHLQSEGATHVSEPAALPIRPQVAACSRA